MPSDQPMFSQLQRWLDEQTFFPECLLPQRLETVRAFRKKQLASGEELAILADGDGFIVWETGLVEEDTGKSVSRLWGYEGDLGRLLALSTGRLEVDSLLVELPAGRSQQSATLERSGFERKRYRLSLIPREHDLDTPRQKLYRLRQGTELDRPLLCSLATTYAVHTLPPGQEQNVQAYSGSILKRFTEIDYGPESPYDLLIATEAATRQSVGYVLVELQDFETAFILDLGVKKSHWGRYVAQFLVRATENLLVEHVIHFLHTEISAANRRSFVTACRSLGFQPRIEEWMC